MFSDKYTRLLTIISITGVLFLAFWQVVFLENSLKWDMLDCYLPWRYHMGECIKNGVFPYWNPYQHFGYPIHASMRSLFYPGIWLIGAMGGYTNYTLHFVFVLYLFLAGVGMAKLSHYFNNNFRVSLAIGIAYSISGYFVSHGQELSTIASATWIPYVLLYFFRMIRGRSYPDMAKTTIFLYLLINGGYQAITIIMGYLLVVIFIYFVVNTIKEKDYKALFRIVSVNLILLLALVVLNLPNIVSLYQVAPYVERLGGLSTESIASFPFSPQSLLSLILPFAVIKETEFFNTDISMTNIYIGIIVLIFFVLRLIQKKKAIEIVLLFFGLFTLLATFGETTPVRGFLFNYIPAMDLFRGSAYFRIFPVIIMFILAGNSISELISDWSKYRKVILYITLSIALIIIVIISYSLISWNSWSSYLFSFGESMFSLLEKSSIYEHILIQGSIQLIVLIVFAVLILRGSFSKIKLLSILLLAVIEMIISVQLNLYSTTISEADPAKLHTSICDLPQGFPAPSLVPVSQNSDKAAAFWPLWRNTSILAKNISYEGFNSFVFRGYEFLFDSVPELARQVKKNPVVYLSDKLYPHESIDEHSMSGIDKRNLYIEDSVYRRVQGRELKHHPSDKVEILDFSPNVFTVSVDCRNQQCITFLQSNYIGWELTVDDKLTEHFTSNYLFISAIVPAGSHTIKLEYNNPVIKYLFIISMAGFSLIMLYLLFVYLKRFPEKRKSVLPIVIIFAGVLAIYVYYKQANREITKLSRYSVLQTTNDFEKVYPDWSGKPENYDSTEFSSSAVSYRMDSTTEYSPTFLIDCSKLPLEEEMEVQVSLKVFSQNSLNALLVYSLENKEVSKDWISAETELFREDHSDWSTVYLSCRILENTSTSDKIKIYLWNKNLESFYIDDFIVKLYSKAPAKAS